MVVSAVGRAERATLRGHHGAENAPYDELITDFVQQSSLG